MAGPKSSSSISFPSRVSQRESVDGQFWITAILSGLAFFAAAHDVFQTSSVGSACDASTHSAAYQFGLLGFGALGCALLMGPARRPLRRPGILVWLLAAYGATCIAWILWSESSPPNVQRLLPLICLGAGVCGLARQFNVRDLTKLVLVVMALHLAIGVAVEVAHGTFHPQNGSYRFAGTLSPEAQGIPCSLLALSALALLRHTHRHLPLHLAFVALGVLFLLLTKSPTSCCAFLAAMLVELFLQPRPDREWLNWSWAPSLALALLAWYVIFDLAGGVLAERFAQLARGAMEVLSQVGILGAAYSIVAMVGLYQARQQFQWTGEEGYRFLVAQIVLGLVHSLMSSQFATASLCVVACTAGLASLATTPPVSPHPTPPAIPANSSLNVAV